MKELGSFSISLLLLTASALSVALAQAPTDDRPIIVVREDDCRATWRVPYAALGGVSALDYGKQKHIPVTWAVITSQTNASTGGSGPLTWAELTDYLQVAGGELASHSVTHTILPSVQAYVSEVVASKLDIEQHVPGYQCRTFLQPGTWGGYPDGNDALHAYLDRFSELNNPIGQAIQANYAQSQAYLGGGWQVGGPYCRYGTTNAYSVDYNYFPSITAMQATLDIVANTPGLAFVVSCHGVQEVGATLSYAVQADMMKAFMDKLAALRDSGKVRLMGMNDAFNYQFSDGLNCMPDGGVEFAGSYPSTNPIGPWRLYSNTEFTATGGMNGTRGIHLSANGDAAGFNLYLSPGQYEFSWYQKKDPNPIGNTPVHIRFRCLDLESKEFYAAYYPTFYSSSIDVWERKNAYVRVKDGSPRGEFHICATGQTQHTIDNVSLVRLSYDPVLSATEFSVTPEPGRAILSWLTPSSPDVTKLRIRYDSHTHPKTPTEGTFLADVDAIPGTHQQQTVLLDWTPLTYAYFSVFAMKADGSFALPDIAALVVSRSSPTPILDAALNVSGAAIDAQWADAPPNGPPYQYQYGLGSNPNSADITAWQTTQDHSATCPMPDPAPDTLFFLVREQNAFGYWSAIAAKQVYQGAITSLLSRPDGSAASVSGVISAVFADCFYVQQADRARGIKVIGDPPSAEGTTAMVTGELTTVASERAIEID